MLEKPPPGNKSGEASIEVEEERLAGSTCLLVLTEAPAPPEPTIQIKGLGGKKKQPVKEVLHKPQQ